MPYNNLIQRSDVAVRIPQQVSNQMLTSLYATSVALAIGTRIPLPAGSTRFPVLSALPQAYWVHGDTGLKQTSTMAWDDKFINVEELACIVPIPDNVLDDVDFDVWEEVRPAMESAISRRVDEAVFLGGGPASFPDSLGEGAIAHSNTVARGTNNDAAGGIHADVSDLIALLEDEGYEPTGGIRRSGLKSIIRKTRIPANKIDQGISADDWYGAAMRQSLPGLWPSGSGAVEAIVGDFTQLVVGVRKDFDYKIITEGVITDDSTPPQIIFNLPQQDMVAMRITFRMGFQVANPINYEQPDETERYAFGALLRP